MLFGLRGCGLGCILMHVVVKFPSFANLLRNEGVDIIFDDYILSDCAIFNIRVRKGVW